MQLLLKSDIQPVYWNQISAFMKRRAFPLGPQAALLDPER
jgi:hypothetical protein